jgi:hypothetical protein
LIGCDEYTHGITVSISVPAVVKKNTPFGPPSLGPYDPSSPTESTAAHEPPWSPAQFVTACVDVICDPVLLTLPLIT